MLSFIDGLIKRQWLLRLTWFIYVGYIGFVVFPMMMEEETNLYSVIQVILAIGVPLLLLVGMSARQRVLQRLVFDRAVEDYLSNSDEIKDNQIVVLLRPFFSENTVSPERSGILSSGLSLLMGNNFLKGSGHIEGALFNTLKTDYLPVRCDNNISRHGKHLLEKLSKMGKVRFASIEDNSNSWLETVIAICQPSKLCFVLPPDSQSKGTIQEIALLANDKIMIKKLVFIMPSEHHKYKTLEKKKVGAIKLWATLKALAPPHLSLPDFQSSGGFLIRADNNPFLITGYSGSPWYSEWAIKHIFLKGRLFHSTFFDSVKIASHLIWGVIFLSLIYILKLMLALLFVSMITENDQFFDDQYTVPVLTLSFFLFILWNLRLHFLYCHRFNLTKHIANTVSLISIISFYFGICLTFHNFFEDVIKTIILYPVHGLKFEISQVFLDSIFLIFVLLNGCVASFMSVYLCLYFYHKYRLVAQQDKLNLLIDPET
jgi:hypothetical protein